MHIYAFGSVCRGDVDRLSDIDLLAVVDGPDDRFDPATYSVYSYGRLEEIWNEGNPFAWHLAVESRIVHSSDGTDFIADLGDPGPYRRGRDDCNKFLRLYKSASESLFADSRTEVFDLSTIFLSMRNIATCYSLATQNADFSRQSAVRIADPPLRLSSVAYRVLERARVLSIRGRGSPILPDDVAAVRSELGALDEWMTALVHKMESRDE
jgi:hypothetical protein